MKYKHEIIIDLPIKETSAKMDNIEIGSIGKAD